MFKYIVKVNYLKFEFSDGIAALKFAHEALRSYTDKDGEKADVSISIFEMEKTVPEEESEEAE